MHILIEGQKTLIGQTIKPVLKLFGLTAVSKVKNEPRPSAFISIDKEIVQVSRKRWKFEIKLQLHDKVQLLSGPCGGFVLKVLFLRSGFNFQFYHVQYLTRSLG